MKWTKTLSEDCSLLFIFLHFLWHGKNPRILICNISNSTESKNELKTHKWFPMNFWTEVLDKFRFMKKKKNWLQNIMTKVFRNGCFVCIQKTLKKVLHFKSSVDPHICNKSTHEDVLQLPFNQTILLQIYCWGYIHLFFLLFMIR